MPLFPPAFGRRNFPQAGKALENYPRASRVLKIESSTHIGSNSGKALLQHKKILKLSVISDHVTVKVDL